MMTKRAQKSNGKVTRVDDLLDLLVLLEELSDSLGVRGVLTHADSEGLETAQSEVAIEGGGDGTHGCPTSNMQDKHTKPNKQKKKPGVTNRSGSSGDAR